MYSSNVVMASTTLQPTKNRVGIDNDLFKPDGLYFPVRIKSSKSTKTLFMMRKER